MSTRKKLKKVDVSQKAVLCHRCDKEMLLIGEVYLCECGGISYVEEQSDYICPKCKSTLRDLGQTNYIIKKFCDKCQLELRIRREDGKMSIHAGDMKELLYGSKEAAEESQFI